MTYALIYHDLAAPAQRDEVGFPGALAARYKLAPERFDEHLDAIAATGAGVGLAQPGEEPPRAAITFDDGGSSATRAAAALERHDWRGHFFVTTGRTGTPGFLDAAGVRALADAGHAVGSHSHSHPTYMGHLTAAEIADEWATSRDALAEILGAPPVTASVPGGFLSDTVVEGARAAGYRLLMTSEPTSRPRRHGDLLVLGRYTIWSTTPARQAAGYVAGRVAPRARLWLEWNAKRIPKQLAPGVYQAARRVRARRA